MSATCGDDLWEELDDDTVEVTYDDYHHMNEIVPNLWLGDLASAIDPKTLREKNIHSVVTVMRGRLTIDETFVNHRVEIDDVAGADILSHFIPAITFIQAELDEGHGVLVHCFAGVSRSTTIVAAYLMYTRGLDVTSALKLIREARPMVEPNHSFVSQLEIFHKAHHTVSYENKATRMYYLERVVKEVVAAKGDEAILKEVFSRLPVSPESSAHPSTSGQRRIRCKMCRQELATRDHIMRHGQAPDVEQDILEHVAPPSTVDEGVRLGEQLSESLSREETAKKDLLKDTSAAVTTAPEVSAQTISASASLESRPPDVSLPKSIPLPADYTSRMVPAAQPRPPVGPPILTNAKCSGYFLEPLKWMQPFLEKGEHAGKIVCPNKKCNAKLGNYDWAGVHCSCNEWVVPGFCIHRSKVDEVS